MTTANQAREWFDNAQATESTPAITELFKYEVQIGFYGSTWYLFTKSPQKIAMGRRSMGDCEARGTCKEDLRAGFERFIVKMEAKIAARKAKTASKREARATFENPYKIGDFLYSSWGYEQTNREFYQIIEIGNNSLKIREVYQERTRDSHDSGTCSPIKDNFRGEAQWVTIQIREKYHSVPSPIHGNLYQYENKPVYFSDGY